ncbi:MAG: hypothetical protein RL227_2886 [Pseudomonadota bacterium]|jgi:hypothetical protein
MTSTPTPGLPRFAKGLIYLLITGLVAVLIWSQLPRGPYSTDLSRIGQGRPALVLAYDIKSMGGMEVMAMMDSLRSTYEDRVHFLVAPLGAPHGFAFGERHDAVNGTVVLFSDAGVAVRSLHQPADTATLQRELDSLLKLPRRN